MNLYFAFYLHVCVDERLERGGGAADGTVAAGYHGPVEHLGLEAALEVVTVADLEKNKYFEKKHLFRYHN